MSKLKYKVLITTSGTGSRLSLVTKKINKALVEVGGKSTLARIIEMYDKEVPLVITLGYLSDQIIDFISKNYPDRKVEYVKVDKYEGTGSSCGYSILQAESKLQCPFIFHACDTIVFEPIPVPDHNWTAGYINSHIAEDVVERNFTTHLIKNDKLAAVNPLGAKEYSYIHIGITAIKDYQEFWKTLADLYKEDPNNAKLTDINAINKMISGGFAFKSTPFRIWLDTGNPDTLSYARKHFEGKKRCKTESREISIITGEKNLEPVFTLPNFPVYMGCTEKDRTEDLFADMEWVICPKSGILQLLKLIPLEILYQNQHNEGLGQVWKDHYCEFVDFVNRFSPKSVLEIGGAHGMIGSMYKDLNAESSWTVIDPNPTVTDNRLKVIKGWFDEGFASKKNFDAVIHSHVLEHLYNPSELIAHIAKFLKEGQMHIFTFPNLYEFLKKKYTNGLNFEHTLFLTEEIVDYLLKINGFEIIEKRYFRDHSIFYSTKKVAPQRAEVPNRYEEYKKMFMDFVNHHQEMVDVLNILLDKSKEDVYLFGAHIFSQYLLAFGLKTEKIVSILDNSQMKQGKRLYGTKFYVESPQVLKGKGKVNVILKAANYNDEIKKDILENINSEVIFW